MYVELSPGKGHIYLLKPDTACLLYRDGQTLQRIEFKCSPPLLEAMGLMRQLDVAIERDTRGGLTALLLRSGSFLGSSSPPPVRLDLGGLPAEAEPASGLRDD
jgi:hypothetical protein